MKHKISLTRYLYFTNEVVLSLVDSVVNKKDLQQSIFWTSEYYYSGYKEETVQLLLKIYYDFYAIHYPTLEKFIIKKCRNWNEDSDIKHILSILTNIVGKNANYDVFVIRQYYNTCPNIKLVFRGRTPKWITDLDIDKKYHKLVRSIEKDCWGNICFYIRQQIQENKSEKELDKVLYEMYRVIIKFYKSKHQIEINDNDTCERTWKTVTEIYKDKLHILFSLILHLSTNEKDIHVDKRKIYLAVDNGNVDYFKTTNHSELALYRVLNDKREYDVNQHTDFISLFNLAQHQEKKYDSIPERNNIDLHILRNEWEYYAYDTPIWYERFQENNAIKDEKTMKITFKTENDYENFYEKWNYEPDEQTLECQLRSCCPQKPLKQDLDETTPEVLSKILLNHLYQDIEMSNNRKQLFNY